MKNVIRFIGLVMAVLFTLVFAACGGGGGCDCDPKAHLGIGETCDCGGSGCNCTEQIATVGGIPIRKVAGVTVKQMNDAVGIIETSFQKLAAEDKLTFKEIVEVIHIVSGNEVSRVKSILSIGLNVTEEVLSANFLFIVLGY